jgi:hypothetical protein
MKRTILLVASLFAAAGAMQCATGGDDEPVTEAGQSPEAGVNAGGNLGPVGRGGGAPIARGGAGGGAAVGVGGRLASSGGAPPTNAGGGAGRGGRDNQGGSTSTQIDCPDPDQVIQDDDCSVPSQQRCPNASGQSCRCRGTARTWTCDSDGGVPDSGKSDTGTPDVKVETGTPDTGTSDTGTPDVEVDAPSAD